MRHNDARKWLHAGLDLLPLILIPIFMVYSHRHTIDGGSIEVPQNEVVDFNQLYTGNNEVRSQYGIDITFDDYYISFEGTSTVEGNFIPLFSFPVKNEHIYYLRDFAGGSINDYNFYGVYDNNVSISPSNGNFTFESEYNSNFDFRIILSRSGLLTYDMGFYFNVYDLTQMFGNGNEPTIEQFNSWYTSDYYNYTVSHKELLKNVSTITYDDTDIMSQFTYQLYNSVDKYFNMGNVFNLGGVYDWFNLNIFAGNAPIAVYIVWQVVLYEFVMDLLFLLYGLFMWFIDMCKHLMEKPFRSIK